jgi:hypothetical protein
VNEVALVIRGDQTIELVTANETPPDPDAPAVKMAGKLVWFAEEIHKALTQEPDTGPDVELSPALDPALEAGPDPAEATPDPEEDYPAEGMPFNPSQEEVDSFVEQAETAEDALQGEISSAEVSQDQAETPVASESDPPFSPPEAEAEPEFYSILAEEPDEEGPDAA